MRQREPVTRQTFAEELAISRKTLFIWLKDSGLLLRRKLITPEQQRLIRQKFGYPEEPDLPDGKQWSKMTQLGIWAARNFVPVL